MMNAKTIITGCGLYIAPEGKTLHGDLWEVADCYVFNGIYDEKGDPVWKFPEQPFRPNEDDRVLIIVSKTRYFERRSIVVIDKASCRMTRAAESHIRQWGGSVPPTLRLSEGTR